MGKLTTKRQVAMLTMLGISVYFCCYLVRINFAAIIVELIKSGVMTKPQAAIITTTAFVTYGIGQLISGVVGDRVSPRWLIFFGYIVTVLMNFLMPVFSDSCTVMAVVWGINGIAQAFMWPPLLKILVSAMSDNDFARTAPFISVGSASATIAIYVVSPVIIKFLDWRYVFYIYGAIAFVFSFLWIVLSGNLLKDVKIELGSRKKSEKSAVKTENKMLSFYLKLLPIIIFTTALQGILRDGITTWMPSLISDKFNVSSEVAILSAVGLPVFQIIINFFTYRVLRLLKYNVFRAITVYFAVSGGLLALMCSLGMNVMWVAVLFVSLSIGTIHGVNALQTIYIPKYFDLAGQVSTMGGIMNFSTYIGSALSTYLFAVISDTHGWGVTTVSWIVIAFVGAVCTMILDKITSSR